MGTKASITYTVLIVVTLATLYFLHRAFDGTTLVLDGGAELGSLFIRLIIFMIVAIIAVQIMRAILHQFIPGIGMPGEEVEGVEEDERDRQIEARGDRIGYYVLCGLLTILLLQYCMAEIYPSGWWSQWTLDRPIEWAVVVVLAMLVSEIVKWGSMAISYRPW